jgi:hypothetical protein
MSKKNENKFMQYIYYWQEKLGLKEWSIIKTDKKINALALCTFPRDRSSKLCMVSLGQYWTIPITDKNLNSVACHEMLHVLLYDAMEYARERPLDVKGIMEKEHEIVNTLENVLTGNTEQ